MDVQMNSLLVSQSSVQSKTVTVKKGETVHTSVQIEIRMDSYEHTEPDKKVTYDKPKTIQQLQEESDKAYSHLKQIVRDMLKRQGLKFRDIEIVPKDGSETDGITLDDLKNIEVDETARKEAQAMIAEGGEYSAEKVSDRIVDFAKAISGGDTSKYDLLKAAIDKGFEAAEADFGDELPDISKETYKLVMEKLDAWTKPDEAPAEQPEEQGDSQPA